MLRERNVSMPLSFRLETHLEDDRINVGVSDAQRLGDFSREWTWGGGCELEPRVKTEVCGLRWKVSSAGSSSTLMVKVDWVEM